MKLSDELKHCLEDDACGTCQYYSTENHTTCRGLLQKAYEQIKAHEDMEITVKEYRNKLLQEFEKQRKIDRSKYFNEEQLQLIDKVFGLVNQTIELFDEE